MTTASARRRLDRILLDHQWVTEPQVEEALMRQRAHGGRFGSHLLYFRYISEHQLASALAEQCGHEGVELSLVEIPADVVALVPSKLAIARRVVPFELQAEPRLLKVACEDPTDSQLQNELAFTMRQAGVRLYVAPELSISTALERYYRGRSVTLQDVLQLALPDVAGALEPKSQPAEAAPSGRRAVLLITREAFAAPLLKSLLERDEYDVHVAEDFEAAVQIASSQPIARVLVHQLVDGDREAFGDRVRRLCPGAAMRTYETPADLLLGEQHTEEAGVLGIKGLELFTSLFGRDESNLQSRMGRYTERLCVKLGLAMHDRLICIHAAYLHDLARLHYAPDAHMDRRTVASLSRRLLASVSYPKPVLDVLESMYAETPPASDRLSLADLGGRILTLVDLYCQNVGPQERLSLDRLDVVKKKLRDLSGRLIPSEIVEAFIALLQEESLDLQVGRTLGQVMLFATDAQMRGALELRLKNEGFRVVTESQEASLAELYRRSRPDVLVLLPGGDAQSQSQALKRLTEQGISLRETPTLLLSDRSALSGLTSMFDSGLEDILAHDVSAEFLAGKVGRLLERAAGRKSSESEAAGTRGRLSDLNLIDLLQALGPSRRTVRITVQPAGGESQLLTVYLLSGDISFAQCNALLGAQAVYHALTWSDGTWLVEAVDTASVPVRNNQLSNESILMEGCRLIDERARAGQLG